MMKTVAVIVSVCVLLLSGCAASSKNGEQESSVYQSSGTSSESYINAESTPTEKNEMSEMKIIINGAEFTAKFSSTKAAEEFKDMLPLTLDMSELNGNEKYFYLDNSLSAKSENIGQINCGDIMLYGSSCVVLFYESFSTSYAYTRIGHIENPDGLKSAVGSGSVTVEFKTD